MEGSGRLIVLSGFTGAGKGTVVKRLISNYPDEYALSISATTRSPRPGEEEGREYFYKTTVEFEEMIGRGELLEYARYVDNYYGTPESYVREQMESGKNVLLEIEIQGGLQIKEKFPDTLLLFMTAPDADMLVGRLRGRGTESDEVIAARLNRAVEEAEGCEVYDYLIVNDDADECAETIHHIIQSEHCRMRYCLDEIETIKQDLKKYAKGEKI